MNMILFFIGQTEIKKRKLVIITDEQKRKSTLDEKKAKLVELKEQLRLNKKEVNDAESNRKDAYDTVTRTQEELDKVSLSIFQHAYLRVFCF